MAESKRTVEELVAGYGGWIRYRAGDLPVLVYARLTDENGRLVISEIYLAPPQEQPGRIDANLLRQIPLGRIEAWANNQEDAARIRNRMGAAGPNLRLAAAHFSTTFNERVNHWVAEMTNPVAPRPAFPALRRLPDPPPLPDGTVADPPAGRDKGDDFYREVAGVYAALAAHVRNPAGRMADANHQPVTTIHRWVKEARRRGFLASGQRGKAG